jgi:hypothetical protein
MSWKIRPRTQNAKTYTVRLDEANTRRKARIQQAGNGYDRTRYDGTSSEES